jgi:hypothetical protein
MIDLIGTIMKVQNFLEREDTKLCVPSRGIENPTVSFLKDRVYIIPDYQREIRWNVDKNLQELLRDLSNGDKFLGNVILNKKSDTCFEIIDGQQRITILLMIIYFIKYKYPTQIDIIKTCPIKIENFKKFNLLVNKNFSKQDISEDELHEIESSDIFGQCDRYIKLWKAISESVYLNTSVKCEAFCRNINLSEFNVIITTTDHNNFSIGYFLDVNLKGVKLDSEDIFKGYLFSQDSQAPIREKWKEFKQKIFVLNKSISYPPMKLLAHYFYCVLGNNENYKQVEFKDDFSIISPVEICGEKHFKGEHLIKVLCDKQYMLNSMEEIIKYIDVVQEIIDNERPSTRFKRLFSSNAGLDHDEIVVIHNFIKKILKDPYTVPKILMMKYVIEILLHSQNKVKSDYRKIYGLYLLAIVFSIFDNQKDIKPLTLTVKDGDWSGHVLTQLNQYFDNANQHMTKITAKYNITRKDDPIDYKFRCKSLATIYNFFEISSGTVKIRAGEYRNLADFISNEDKYSVEHFIVNDGKKFKIEDVEDYYPDDISKNYAKSIFNFIFISQDLNNNLSYYTCKKKIAMLKKQDIKCNYSKMIIETARKFFANEPEPDDSTVDINSRVRSIKDYYEKDFPEAYGKYSNEVIDLLVKRIKDL